MNKRMNKRGVPLLLIIMSAMIVVTFYGKPLFSPNAYIFSDSGDGLKNYYTYYYHIRHDSSCTSFEGMNYPYGEHFMYTDCHPFLASLLRAFDDDGSIAKYSPGIVNFMMIISIFLSFIIIFFILREFGIHAWMSLLFSIGIGLLAPQLFRMSGHLSLSYSMAIPLSWLLMIRSYKLKSKYVSLILLFLLNLFWLFTHAYLGMIIIAFQFAFWLMLLLLDRKRWSIITHIFYTLCYLLPILLFQLFIKLTDTHAGRTDNPSGFFSYNAEPDDIFLPHHPPFRPLLDRINGLNIDQEWEAWSYIGLAFTILFVVYIGLAVARIFRKKMNRIFALATANKLLNISLLASLFVLLFAFAFPFKMIPELTDYIPLIKQFRATGRFAWVFFFAGSTFAVFMLQQIFKILKGKPVIAYAIVITAAGLCIAEGLPYHLEVSGKITKNKNLFLMENADPAMLDALSTIESDDFQAIIPLPFFYYGSESYSRPLHEQSVRNTLLFSAYTGLPQFSAYLTRTSVQESKNIVQLMSPGWYKKEIEGDINDERDFLIIKTQASLSKYEKMVLKNAEEIYKSELFSLLRITKDDLFKKSADTIIAEFALISHSLIKKNGFLLEDSLQWFYYNPFEDQFSDINFRGSGAYSGSKKGKNTFAEFPPNTFDAQQEYVLSAWMYNHSKDALNLWFRFMVEEYDEENDQWYITTSFPESSEVINGNWSMVEIKFNITDPANHVYVVSKGKDNSQAPLYIDDLLIRKSGEHIYHLDTDDKTINLFWNNHEIISNLE